MSVLNIIALISLALCFFLGLGLGLGLGFTLGLLEGVNPT